MIKVIDLLKEIDKLREGNETQGIITNCIDVDTLLGVIDKLVKWEPCVESHVMIQKNKP